LTKSGYKCRLVILPESTPDTSTNTRNAGCWSARRRLEECSELQQLMVCIRNVFFKKKTDGIEFTLHFLIKNVAVP
jgi:hypothetical protein